VYRGRQIQSLGINATYCYCITHTRPRYELHPCETHAKVDQETIAFCRTCEYEFIGPADYEINLMRSSDSARYWTAKLARGQIKEAHLQGDTVTLLTSRDAYGMTIGGEKTYRQRHGAFQQADLSGGRTVLSTADGAIAALSSEDGRRLWSQSIEGRTWDLLATGDWLYVTAGIPQKSKDDDARDASGAPAEPTAMTAQEKLFREMAGGRDEKERAVCSPASRTLLCYGIDDGRERWRKEAFIGEIYATGDGDYLRLLQGREAAGLFMNGTGSVLYEHRHRDGGACWRYRVPLATESVVTGEDHVFLINEPGHGIFGAWNADVEDVSSIRAIRRRTRVNRIRKL
jgi:hypothetical protein